ncbi:MAG: protein kinase [Myxococcota bacterium]
MERLIADRYRLLDLLGRGGTAVVYRGYDTLLGVERAIKVLQVPFKARERFRQRMRNEARAMARLTNPHLLQVYDIGTDGAHDYIVMALAEGGSLGDHLLQNGALAPWMAVGFTLQLLYALDTAHHAGIVHRDIKPGNLLLNGDGAVMLADFGIALIRDADFHRNTAHGSFLGSMAFMAPEQRLDASSVQPSADIYAVGSTLYALVTASSSIDLFTAGAKSPRWSGVEPRLAAIIRDAVQQNPQARFSSARQMAGVLAELLPTLPGRSGAPVASRIATQAAIELLLKGSPSPPLTGHPAPPPSSGTSLTDTFLPPQSDAYAPTLTEDPNVASREAVLSGSQTSRSGTTAAVPNSPWRAWRLDGFLLAFGGVMLAGGLGFLVRPSSQDAQVLPSTSSLAPAPSSSGSGVLDPDFSSQTPSIDEVPPALALPAEVETVEVETVEESASSVVSAPPPRAATAPAHKEPAPEAVADAGKVSGLWKGIFNGRQAHLQLYQRGADLSGEFVVRFGKNESHHQIQGRYDERSGTLTFEDLDQRTDAGVYDATLSDDARRLRGQFTTRSGRSIRFEMRRS